MASEIYQMHVKTALLNGKWMWRYTWSNRRGLCKKTESISYPSWGNFYTDWSNLDEHRINAFMYSLWTKNLRRPVWITRCTFCKFFTALWLWSYMYTTLSFWQTTCTWSTSWRLALSANLRWATLASCISFSAFILRGIEGCRPLLCINESTSIAFGNSSAWRIVSPSERHSMRRLRCRRYRMRSTNSICTKRMMLHTKSQWGSWCTQWWSQDRTCICSKCGKLVYIKIGLDALDGNQTNHALFEGHLRYEVTHQRRSYQRQRVCGCELVRQCRNHRSTSRYVIFVGEGNVLWNSKRQQTVAHLTMQAEYMAMNWCTREAIWLGN